MLTAKQERFVQELVKGKSQREAYKCAYDCSRLKDKSIDEIASRTFKQVKIRSRYEELMAEITARAVDDAVSIREMIIDVEKAIVNANMGQIYEVYKDVDGAGNIETYVRPRSQEELDKFDMRAVQEIRFDTKGRPIFKLYDKQPAVNTLRELFGISAEEKAEDNGFKIVIQAEGYDK